MTHPRALPLPLSIDLVFHSGSGRVHRCVYQGHGASKVVYRFADETSCYCNRAVLKLTPTKDIEPHVFIQLSRLHRASEPAGKLCPTIMAVRKCQELDAERRPVREWCAWLEESTVPLDKYMVYAANEKLYDLRKAIIRAALYKQVVAAEHGFILGDNSLSNFGIAQNTVVIIDAGYRDVKPTPIAKGTMNSYCIHNWWQKIQWHCLPGELQECQYIWRKHHKLHDVAQELRDAGVFLPKHQLGGRSAEQPASRNTTKQLDSPPSTYKSTAQVAEITQVQVDLNSLENNDAAQWLLEQCLAGQLGQLKLLRSGAVIPLEHNEVQPPHIRLQTLIHVTQTRRKRWTRSSNEILSEETLQKLIHEWRNDAEAWMNASTRSRYLRQHPGSMRSFARRRFRSFLFHMVGCYELVLFCLRVGFSWQSLKIFHEIFASNSASPRHSKLDQAIQAVERMATKQARAELRREE